MFVVTVPELTVVVLTPGVQSALPGQNYGKASFRNLKVQNIKFVNALNTMRSVKLTEDSSAPDKELVVS